MKALRRVLGFALLPSDTADDADSHLEGSKASLRSGDFHNYVSTIGTACDVMALKECR